MPVTAQFYRSLFVFVQKIGLQTTFPSLKNLKMPLCVGVLTTLRKIQFFIASLHMMQTSSQQLQLLMWSRPCGLANLVLFMLRSLLAWFIKLMNYCVQNFTLSQSSVKSMLLISNQMTHCLPQIRLLFPALSKYSTAPRFQHNTVAESLPLGSINPKSKSSTVIHAFSSKSAVVPMVEQAHWVTLKQVVFKLILYFSHSVRLHRAVMILVSEAIYLLALDLKPRWGKLYHIGGCQYSRTMIWL